jgi:hypothetical protein
LTVDTFLLSGHLPKIISSILLFSALVTHTRASAHLRGRELETTYDWSQLGGNIQAGTTDWRDSDFHVAISGDGDTTAVGSPVVDNARGKVVVTRFNSGSSFARVYKLDGSSKEWAQLGSDIFTADSSGPNWRSGFTVHLDLEGTTVALGAPGYTIEGCCTPGQVRVYTFDQGSDDWEPLGQPLQGPFNSTQENFGFSLSLSGDGSTLAAGSRSHSGAAGLVQVFDMNNETTEWLSLGNSIDSEGGSEIDLSEDGTILAVGQGQYQDPSGSGFITDTGLVRIYRLDLEQGSWIQKGGAILPDETTVNGWGAFGDGRSLSLSSNGNTIAVTAPAQSVNGIIFGLVRVFLFDGTDWSTVGSTIPGEKRYDSNTVSGTGFVSLSSDGGRVVVGAPMHQICDGPLAISCVYSPQANTNWTGHIRVFELSAVETLSPTSSPAPTLSPTEEPTLGSAASKQSRTGLAYYSFLALSGCMLLL